MGMITIGDVSLAFQAAEQGRSRFSNTFSSGARGFERLHSPIDAQAAAMRLTPPSQHRADAPLLQGAPMRLRIIGSVALHLIGATTRAADPTGHGRNAIHQLPPSIQRSLESWGLEAWVDD